MKSGVTEFTIDCVEGCLLDSFMLACKRGYAAVYETCLNEWSSTYRVEFEAGPAQTVWRRWYEFEERSERSA